MTTLDTVTAGTAGTAGLDDTALTSEQPTHNGHVGARVQLTLQPGETFTARKCALCEGKCPPHPATLAIDRPLGALELVLCARCDVAITMLAGIVGPGEATLRIKGQGPQQGDLFAELEAAAQQAADAVGEDDEDDEA